MRFELAGRQDEPALRRLLRESPMEGDIHLSLEREPRVEFANGIGGDSTDVLVGRLSPNQPPIAMGACSRLTSFVNGTPTQVGYLGQLRIHHSYRGRAGILRRGYSALRELNQLAELEQPFITTIAVDNEPARRLFEAGVPGLPKYRPLGDIFSLTFSTTARRWHDAVKISVSQASAADWAEISACLQRYGERFQFAPCWTRKELLSPARSRGLHAEDFLVVRSGSQIVGCLACWDQREFKQIVVRGYSARMKVIRPIWNLLAPLAGAPKLPGAGSAMPVIFLSHLAVDGDDPEIFIALLRAGLGRAASLGATHAILGVAERNPITAAATPLKPRIYRSRAYLVCWPEAEAAAQRVDGRALHLEVAIL